MGHKFLYLHNEMLCYLPVCLPKLSELNIHNKKTLLFCLLFSFRELLTPTTFTKLTKCQTSEKREEEMSRVSNQNIVKFWFNSLSFLCLFLLHIVSFGKRSKRLAYPLLGLNTDSTSWIEIIKAKLFLGFRDPRCISTNQYFHLVPFSHFSCRYSLSAVSSQSKFQKK